MPQATEGNEVEREIREETRPRAEVVGYDVNGFSTFAPERTKSSAFRVTTVSLCSNAVAAINPSVTGSG
jgi:hypothetical protein